MKYGVMLIGTGESGWRIQKSVLKEKEDKIYNSLVRLKLKFEYLQCTVYIAVNNEALILKR